MSERIEVTRTPVQITDGTNSAHITLDGGAFEYADSAASAAWHRALNRTLDVRAPVKLFLRTAVDSGATLNATVTTYTE